MFGWGKSKQNKDKKPKQNKQRSAPPARQHPQSIRNKGHPRPPSVSAASAPSQRRGNRDEI